MNQTLVKSTAFDIAPGRVTIDTRAIVANWQMLAKLSGNAETAAVLKADAYGLGAEPVARALHRAGCRTYFVASIPEGAALRAWYRRREFSCFRVSGRAGNPPLSLRI